jgi:hypothetical protein
VNAWIVTIHVMVGQECPTHTGIATTRTYFDPYVLDLATIFEPNEEIYVAD